MNYAQFKQYLGNNLWNGEEFRRSLNHYRGLDFFERALASTLIMPDQTKVWGIDISGWNIPPVDLQRMIDLYSLDFVIVKGCDGTLTAKYFEQHKASAKAADIPWGVYCWLYPDNRVSIDTQTTAWANQYLADPPPMGVFIDCESTKYAGSPANPLTADLRMAHDKFKAKTRRAATTYTSPGYASSYLKGFDWSREELWIAHYGVDAPDLPTGAKTYNLWQFTDHLDGSKLDPNGDKEIDGSYYKGTHEQFAARYGAAAPIPEPPPDNGNGDNNMETTKKGTALQSNINVKGMVTGKIVVLNNGQVVYGNLSAGGTDLIDIKRIYAANGSLLTTLSETSKVSIGTWLRVEAGQDPADVVVTPDPTPPPVVKGDIHLDATLHADGTLTGKWTES